MLLAASSLQELRAPPTPGAAGRRDVSPSHPLEGDRPGTPASYPLAARSGPPRSTPGLWALPTPRINEDTCHGLPVGAKGTGKAPKTAPILRLGLALG